jgi:alkaline phosphatase D
VFSRHRWGQVELFLLDGRYHRGVDGTLLGAAQMDWLLEGLAESDATFKLLASGSQWSPYGSDDSWAAWDEDRARVLQAIVDDGIEGVVLLSGDIHRFELRELTPASGGYVLPEITSSPLAYTLSSGCGSDGTEPDRRTCLDGFDGFIGLTVDTTLADPTLTAEIIDGAGGVRETWTILRSTLR